jgi:hypothetical protein
LQGRRDATSAQRKPDHRVLAGSAMALTRRIAVAIAARCSSISLPATCRLCRCRSSSAAHRCAQYAFGPTIGSAVNVALLTYVDTRALGIDVDTTAIPRRPIRASRPIPKRSQAHIDLGDGLAQRGGSTNHGTVRL